MKMPAIVYVFGYCMLLLFAGGLLTGCGQLNKEDTIFISTAAACEEIGYGLTGASKFKARFTPADIAKVESIITESSKICKDRNKPPSVTETAGNALVILMNQIQSLVVRYAAGN